MNLDVVVSCVYPPESKGIELKSFSFNINYDSMASVDVMYGQIIQPLSVNSETAIR